MPKSFDKVTWSSSLWGVISGVDAAAFFLEGFFGGLTEVALALDFGFSLGRAVSAKGRSDELDRVPLPLPESLGSTSESGRLGREGGSLRRPLKGLERSLEVVRLLIDFDNSCGDCDRPRSAAVKSSSFWGSNIDKPFKFSVNDPSGDVALSTSSPM